MKKNIQILLVEDSVSYAEGMELLLIQNENIGKVHHVVNYQDTLNFLKDSTNPFIDIIILDLNFETDEFDGETIAKKVRQQYPEMRIIVLTQLVTKYYYNKLFKQCKVNAFLDKQLSVEETYNALEAVMNGDTYIDKNIARMIEIGQFMHITKREQEVLELLVKGNTQKKIAAKLFISPKTVEVHIRNLFERFEVKSSTELVVKYLRYKNGNRNNNDGSTSEK